MKKIKTSIYVIGAVALVICTILVFYYSLRGYVKELIPYYIGLPVLWFLFLQDDIEENNDEK